MLDHKDAASKAVVARMEIGKVIKGYAHEIFVLIATLFADGHALVEAVPGTGKTVLLKTMSTTMGGTSARLQGTPGVMDTDVVGYEVYNRKTNDFDVKHGVFEGVNFLLVDEGNRLPQKTMSALLEAPEERHYTIARQEFALEDVFMMMMTQNPIDHAGTGELISALKSRMTTMINLGYVDEDDELAMLKRSDQNSEALEKLTTVFSVEEIKAVQGLVREVRVDDEILRYINRLVRATREHPGVAGGGFGASPRSSEHLRDMTKALAVMAGREFAIPSDTEKIAPFVLEHAVEPGFQSFDNSSVTHAEIVRDVIDSIELPKLELPDTAVPALELVKSA